MAPAPSPHPKFIRRLFSTARYRAKQKNVEFSITIEDLVIPSVCPVFGIPLIPTIGTGARNASTPSVDRRNNAEGYTKDNTCIISFKANQYKGDMTIAEVEALLKYMKGE